MVQPHGEEEAIRIDDLDLLTHSRPQRSGQVAGVGANDDSATALTPSKK
jgi:hypothetical protein